MSQEVVEIDSGDAAQEGNPPMDDDVVKDLWDYEDDIPCVAEDDSEDVEIVPSQEERGYRKRGYNNGGKKSASKCQPPRNKRRCIDKEEALTIDSEEDDGPSPALDHHTTTLTHNASKLHQPPAHTTSNGAAHSTDKSSNNPSSKPSMTTQPAQSHASTTTRALLEQSKRALQAQTICAEEDEGSPYKPSTNSHASTAAAAGQHAGVGMHARQPVALQLAARAAEMLRQQQELERLQRQQEAEEQRRQLEVEQQQGEGLQGAQEEAGADLQGAHTQAAEPHRHTVVCQYKGGEIRLRIAPTQTVGALLDRFVLELRKRITDGSLPQQSSEFRLEFDGERLDLHSTVDEAGIEDGDRLDVMWK